MEPATPPRTPLSALKMLSALASPRLRELRSQMTPASAPLSDTIAPLQRRSIKFPLLEDEHLSDDQDDQDDDSSNPLVG